MIEIRHLGLFVLCLLQVWLCCGCSKSVKVIEEQEARTGLMKKARLEELNGNAEAAARLYREALAKNSQLVRAHLDLALLLHDQAHDYVGAIYHYRRYLELRPETEKRNMIEERIRQAERTFAASISVDSSELVARIADLEQENARLRNRIAQASRGPAPEDEADKSPYDGEAAPGGDTRSYVVKSGDTLSTIAAQMYQDTTKWKIIADANRDTLNNSDRLRVGQVLVIP